MFLVSELGVSNKHCLFTFLFFLISVKMCLGIYYGNIRNKKASQENKQPYDMRSA